MITDQPEKVIAAELIREKILHLLSDEVPHGVGVEVVTFKKRDDKTFSIFRLLFTAKRKVTKEF